MVQFLTNRPMGKQ